MKSLIALLVLTATMAGCAVYTPSGSLVVDPGVAATASSGHSFCPPGLAKQGRC